MCNVAALAKPSHTPVNSNTCTERSGDPLTDLLTSSRYDGDTCIFIDTLDDEVDGFGCYEIRDDGIQRDIGPEQEIGDYENEDIEDENDVPDACVCLSA